MRGPVHKMFSLKSAAIGLGSVEMARNPDRPDQVSQISGKMAASIEVPGDTIWVMFEGDKEGIWYVTFDSQTNKLEKRKTFQSTGAGHAGRILATVTDIIKDFVVHYNPTELRFTAKDQKRASIYKAIVKKVGNYNKYKTRTSKHGDKGEYFSLQR